MPTGIFLIKWDEVLGGTIYLRYPEHLEIPEPIVQQITISHNFTESYIITEEKEWNSVSYYNENEEMILVLVLNKGDDGKDYAPPNSSLLEEFNKELSKEIKEHKLKNRLETMYKESLEQFRTTESVIRKLSEQVAELRTKEYDYEERFAKIQKLEYLPVKSKILFQLAVNDTLSFDDIRRSIKTSAKWLNNVIETLMKNDIIGYNPQKDVYYIKI